MVITSASVFDGARLSHIFSEGSYEVIWFLCADLIDVNECYDRRKRWGGDFCVSTEGEFSGWKFFGWEWFREIRIEAKVIQKRGDLLEKVVNSLRVNSSVIRSGFKNVFDNSFPRPINLFVVEVWLIYLASIPCIMRQVVSEFRLYIWPILSRIFDNQTGEVCSSEVVVARFDNCGQIIWDRITACPVGLVCVPKIRYIKWISWQGFVM